MVLSACPWEAVPGVSHEDLFTQWIMELAMQEFTLVLIQ
jgi:hypothetical protein